MLTHSPSFVMFLLFLSVSDPSVHAQIHPPTNAFLSFIDACIHSFTRSFVPSFVRSFVCSFTHSLIHSFTHSLIHSFTHSFLRSFIPSLIHSFIQWNPSITHLSSPRMRYMQSCSLLAPSMRSCLSNAKYQQNKSASGAAVVLADNTCSDLFVSMRNAY